ncbi:MAG: copper resistance protein NlpE [Candidatus Margulisbacteria bacterium]|jgi:hypothetical protein|nr:copper resistance protein NlpE [Candidatus Margulisiibacteriota bacterium]
MLIVGGTILLVLILAVLNSDAALIPVQGTYVGSEPCADCKDIDTVIQIRDDKFSVRTKYLDEADYGFLAYGRVHYHKNNIIELGSDSKLYYRVEKNGRLRHIGPNRHKSGYVLHKAT